MAKGDLTIVVDEKDLAKMNALLEQYDKVDQANIIQFALKRGMEVIVNEGKSNLARRNKQKTGNLTKSFKMTTNKKKAYSLGGFNRGKGGNHAHLVDKGTLNRWTKSGAYRGSVSKGNPQHGSAFWTDAVETKGQEGLQRLMDAIYTAISEINNRNT